MRRFGGAAESDFDIDLNYTPLLYILIKKIFVAFLRNAARLRGILENLKNTQIGAQSAENTTGKRGQIILREKT